MEEAYARARYNLDIDDKVKKAGPFDNKLAQEEQEVLVSIVFFFGSPMLIEVR